MAVRFVAHHWGMSITSRPNPSSDLFTHSIAAHASGPPAEHFADSIAALSQPSDYPMVTAWECEDGTYGIEVSLLNERPTPNAEDVAALEGTLAETLASVRA